ncbi:MAG: hypothetical protein IH602_15410 [Bryobacteraceae bacterium]|nr:hypothetical protein [Bryobacteraceae bacterium]
MRRAILTLLFIWVGVHQTRFTWETYLARQDHLFVPLTLKPFTNEIEWAASPSQDFLAGDGVIAVRRKVLTGSSHWWRELAAAYREKSSDLPLPLELTIASAEGPTMNVEVYRQHCNCGIMGSELICNWLFPPLYILALGFVAATKRPDSRLAWLLLFAAISVSVFRFHPIHPPLPFTESVDPRMWSDAMRIPAMTWEWFFRLAWPAWLLLAFRRTWWAGWAVIGYALCGAVTYCFWAENFSVLEPWQRELNFVFPWFSDVSLGAHRYVDRVMFALARGPWLSVVQIGLGVISTWGVWSFIRSGESSGTT